VVILNRGGWRWNHLHYETLVLAELGHKESIQRYGMGGKEERGPNEMGERGPSGRPACHWTKVKANRPGFHGMKRKIKVGKVIGY